MSTLQPSFVPLPGTANFEIRYTPLVVSRGPPGSNPLNSSTGKTTLVQRKDMQAMIITVMVTNGELSQEP